MSSIQCTWTREKLSDDQLVRVRLSFSFSFFLGMHQNMNLAKSGFFSPPFCLAYGASLFQENKVFAQTLVRKKHFLRSTSSQSLGTFSQHQIHVGRHLRVDKRQAR